MTRVLRQSWVTDPFHGRVALQKFGHDLRVPGVRAHSPGQRTGATKRQPAVERRWHRSTKHQRLARAFEKIIVVSRDKCAARHVTVPAEVLRGRVPHHVYTAIERALDDRRGESAIAH